MTGQLLGAGGLANRIVDFTNLFVGRLPGGALHRQFGRLHVFRQPLGVGGRGHLGHRLGHDPDHAGGHREPVPLLTPSAAGVQSGIPSNAPKGFDSPAGDRLILRRIFPPVTLRSTVHAAVIRKNQENPCET
jgi:hypothetical protein